MKRSRLKSRMPTGYECRECGHIGLVTHRGRGTTKCEKCGAKVKSGALKYGNKPIRDRGSAFPELRSVKEELPMTKTRSAWLPE